MNITTKKLLIIITALLAGAAFMSSCTKEPGVKAKAASKGKKSPPASKITHVTADTTNTIAAIRNGQYVKLSWHVDLAGDKDKARQIEIIRSPTGKKDQATLVARLNPATTMHTDCLPDRNAYWYWVQLLGKNNEIHEIGPVRVDMDNAGSAGYIKLEDKYRISITRTDEAVTLKWDFPKDDYDVIAISRASHIISSRPFTRAGNPGKATSVVKTLEGTSKYTDLLANPNADYWYWFQITLKSGAIVERGPIKAEYVNQ